VTQTARVRLDWHGDCALATLDRQEKLNALDSGMLESLERTIAEVRQSEARVFLLTGAGSRAFCSGADLHESSARSADEHRRSISYGQRVVGSIADLAIPSIALINGVALGGGLELAVACDFRLCTATARLGCPEVGLGMLPGYGGTQRLPRLIGQSNALEMILSGDPIPADLAHAMGLVNKVVDGDILAAGLAFAARLSRNSKVSVRLARAAVQEAAVSSLADGLRSEVNLATTAFASDDAREGMQAFLEKRSPRFLDRQSHLP
jgi:enoyl-CoA hydratase